MFAQENQIDLMRKNYEKRPHCLSKFGCAYAHIWILWESSVVMRLTDSTHIEKELQDCKSYGFQTVIHDISTLAQTLFTHCQTDSAMQKVSPEDPILTKMIETANRRLREAQLREEDHSKDIPSDDLVYTKVGAGCVY